MYRIIFRRSVTGLMVILFVITMTFFMLRILPGGPFDTEKQIPPNILENIEKKYGFDQPLWKQYAIYMGNLVRGDFGPSYKYRDRSANDIISETLPVSLELGLAAMVLSLIGGIAIGVISSLSPRGIVDFASAVFSTSLVSVPNFVVGAVLIYYLSVKYGIFPAALWGKPEHFVLPTLTLASGSLAYIARLVRSNMLDVSNELYVRTARAKGLNRSTIVMKHIFRNAVIPVTTVMGPISAYMVTGSFVVEHIFAIPGMGRFFVFAVSNRDYSVVLAITIVYTVILVLANLIVDVLYSFLDPRIKHREIG